MSRTTNFGGDPKPDFNTFRYDLHKLCVAKELEECIQLLTNQFGAFRKGWTFWFSIFGLGVHVHFAFKSEEDAMLAGLILPGPFYYRVIE